MKARIQRLLRWTALSTCLLWAGSDIRADTPLLAFDFNLGNKPIANVDNLKSLGFRGVVTRIQKQVNLKKLMTYARYAREVGDFRVMAYVVYDFADPGSSNVWRNALPILASSNAPLWVIVRNAPSKLVIPPLLQQMAEESHIFGVRTVVYPHWDTSIETAAKASALIDLIGHFNLKNSLHTCHEIRGGNQYKLETVVQKHASETALVAIAGADANAYFGPPSPFVNWSDAIKPLDKGAFSLLPFLQALEDSGYDGPVILQTFGITNDPNHLQRSIRKYAAYAENVK